MTGVQTCALPICIQTPSSSSGAQQTIAGLQPSTTYVFKAWGKVATGGEQLAIGVKNYGGAETWTTDTSTTWQQNSTTFTTGPTNTSATIYCYKASGSGSGFCDDYTLDGLAPNGGFENGIGAWTPIYTNDSFIVPSPTHTGQFALETPTGGHNGVQEVISGLSPSTTYTLRGWGAVATAGEELRIGVYNYGGSETYASLYGTSFGQATVTFTTGSTSTSATIYCLKQSGYGVGYCDDVTLTGP